MSVMVVDRSGRGHALAELFAESASIERVYYVPGCKEIGHPKIVCYPDIHLSDVGSLIALAKEKYIDYAFIANTSALVNGYVDQFRSAGLLAIGPDRHASRLEGSKTYAKKLCSKYGIPVAEYEIFDDAELAINYVNSSECDLVVKADGLCNGSGSYVCSSKDEAIKAIYSLMVDRRFGDSGKSIVIEKKLTGVELSFFVLFDGDSFVVLPMALDYKRSDDGNLGVNGGGMGSVSPHPLEGDRLTHMLNETILSPLRDCILAEGLEYNGVIYIGSILSSDGLRVLEFNVRFGDPEASALLPRIRSDFGLICNAILNCSLHDVELVVSDDYFCNVVATQGPTRQLSKGKNKGWYKGWPYGRYGRGYPISGFQDVDRCCCKLFFGEAQVHESKGLVTDGGRVIHVVGIAKNKNDAILNAYTNVSKIYFEGVRFRSDIGSVYNDTSLISDEDLTLDKLLYLGNHSL